MKVVLLNQLLEVHHARAISSDDEVDVLELSKDLWDDCQEQVHSFAVLKSRNKHNVYLIWVASLRDFLLSHGWVWSKLLGVNCIWDGEGLQRVNFGS